MKKYFFFLFLFSFSSLNSLWAQDSLSIDLGKRDFFVHITDIFPLPEMKVGGRLLRIKSDTKGELIQEEYFNFSDYLPFRPTLHWFFNGVLSTENYIYTFRDGKTFQSKQLPTRYGILETPKALWKKIYGGLPQDLFTLGDHIPSSEAIIFVPEEELQYFSERFPHRNFHTYNALSLSLIEAIKDFLDKEANFRITYSFSKSLFTFQDCKDYFDLICSRVSEAQWNTENNIKEAKLLKFFQGLSRLPEDDKEELELSFEDIYEYEFESKKIIVRSDTISPFFLKYKNINLFYQTTKGNILLSDIFEHLKNKYDIELLEEVKVFHSSLSSTKELENSIRDYDAFFEKFYPLLKEDSILTASDSNTKDEFNVKIEKIYKKKEYEKHKNKVLTKIITMEYEISDYRKNELSECMTGFQKWKKRVLDGMTQKEKMLRPTNYTYPAGGLLLATAAAVGIWFFTKK